MNSNERQPVWLDRMTYAWSPDPKTPDPPWALSIDWCSDSRGRLVPARVELASVLGVDWSEPPTFTDEQAEAVRAVTRVLLNSVPLGLYVEQSRQELLAEHEIDDPECCEVTAAADADPPADEFDALLRRVAYTYRMAVHRGSRTPARDTWQALTDAGVTTLRATRARPDGSTGEPAKQLPNEQRVRTWIRQARERNYLPPTGRPEHPMKGMKYE